MPTLTAPLPLTATRTPGRARRSILSRVQRQLQLIVLGHIWVLAPLAGAWFLVPGWRGENPPPATPALAFLTIIAGIYLVVRTVLTLHANDRTEAALIAARHGLGPAEGEPGPSTGGP